MDANTERQLKGLARRFLPKLFRWLKKKFTASQAGSGNHGQSYGQQQASYNNQGGQASYASHTAQPFQPATNYQQSYQQPASQQSYQQPTYQQPVYQQPAYLPPQGDTFPHPSHQWTSSGEGDANVTSLRNQAIQENDEMKRCFDQAHQAHSQGDGARAKDLSNEGHEHQARRDQLNKQASDLIFREKNSHQPQGTIDLHGLYVQEAIDQAEDAIRNAQASGLPELRIIVGKGIHSQAHVAKIKPAIEGLMHKYNLSAHLDPHNTGVLIVNLSGQGTKNSNFVNDLARQMPGNDDQCTIS